MRVSIVIAVIGLATTVVTTALPCPSVDWTAVLRFVAPTAFEIRPLKVLIEGGRPA